MEIRRIHAFDFDGTLIKRDTFLEFICYANGMKATLLGLLRLMPQLCLMKAGMAQRDKVKQNVFAWFFKGMDADAFNTLCKRFAADKRRLLRRGGMDKIGELLAEGHSVLIVTASITHWVRPFFEGYENENLTIIGTEAAIEDGRLTGSFSTANCRGAEKVRRIEELFPAHNAYFLTAYGDSKGDNELLDFSDEGYYKPFRHSASEWKKL